MSVSLPAPVPLTAFVPSVPTLPHPPPSRVAHVRQHCGTVRPAAIASSPVPPRAGLSAPPPFHDPFSGGSSPEAPRDLHWKDRVALYAQFSAEETLYVLLAALRANTASGPHKDDGIDALYVFANLDIWALSHRFFGRKMDLGQFERFKRVVVAHPYDVLLRDYHTRTLSAVHVNPDVYVSRRLFEHDGQRKVFTFTMSRAQFGSHGRRAWMVDSIIYDPDDQLVITRPVTLYGS